MELTPEERHRIYEEEKARIETEQKQEKSGDIPTLNLPQNLACTLCYALFWISGIIFLVLEKKDKVVNFHAIQSIVLFGGLGVLSACLSWIPYAGGFFGAAIGILAFIFWIVLMIKAYQGERYKAPLAGDIAEAIHKSVWKTDTAAEAAGENVESVKEKNGEDFGAAVSQKADNFGKKVDDYFTRTRTGRIIGYSFAIFWNIVLIIFFSLFYEYIAWYSVGDDGSLVITPMLTSDFMLWMPVLITSLSICIVANIILIVYDRYWFREAVQILLELIGMAVVIYLVIIFPFDFSVIPNAVAAGILPTVTKVVFIFVAVAFGVSALVRFIKMVLNIENREYTN
ncbi:MAG: hypothetical protein PHF74_02985 [Dehalococcoidales bacterium]|nr:hypothetical protein [Dehalococcoidales bacterium]